jgi:hypothetical protein
VSHKITSTFKYGAACKYQVRNIHTERSLSVQDTISSFLLGGLKEESKKKISKTSAPVVMKWTRKA